MPNFMISILKGNFTWCFTKGNPHNMLPETNMICSWKWTVKGKLLSFPFRRIGKHSARWVGTYPRPELSKKLEKGFLESFGICFGGFLEYVPGAYTLKVPTAKATEKWWERKTILPFWLRQIFRCEMMNFKGWGLCWRFLQVSLHINRCRNCVHLCTAGSSDGCPNKKEGVTSKRAWGKRPGPEKIDRWPLVGYYWFEYLV